MEEGHGGTVLEEKPLVTSLAPTCPDRGLDALKVVPRGDRRRNRDRPGSGGLKTQGPYPPTEAGTPMDLRANGIGRNPTPYTHEGPF